MRTQRLYIGIVLVIIIVIIAYFGWQYVAKRRKDRFSYSTPSTPRVREAVGDLFARLKQLGDSGQEFEAQVARLPDATAIVAVRVSVAQLTSVVDRTGKTLLGAPPTYANYLAVYRGLTSTDQALLDAADAYVDTGHQISQDIAASPDGASTGDYADAASSLLTIGAQLRAVVASVHRLGVALDVE